MGDWFRNILSCCDRDEEDDRPALHISGPTNFRREDISIAGLDPEHQRWIRQRAISDASKMWDHLQPLRSSPSGQFATNPNHTATLPTYEQFTTPRSAPAPTAAPPTTTATAGGGRRRSSGAQPSPLDRVRAHTRKISNSLTKPLGGGGYQAVGAGRETGGNPYEMRALMDPGRTQVVSPGKLSGESLSVAGSEEESCSGEAKGGMVRI
ncbi:hypothetical protein LTR85_009805 [Meristemomyces frigidus]|nr:hypothetical protein LTR85_009805 [Meristemomyces frigidus]